MWPFPPKRFKGNALLSAGSLGLDTDGRVAALGDFNGDQLYVCFEHFQDYAHGVEHESLALIWFPSDQIKKHSLSTSGITVSTIMPPSHIPRL